MSHLVTFPDVLAEINQTLVGVGQNNFVVIFAAAAAVVVVVLD